MEPISPGVYSKITDLSTYVEAVPSTIAFVAFFADKGRDNQLVFKSSRKDLLNEFGYPNIEKYSTAYGQGLLIADKFIQNSTALYCMRALPADATYANIAVKYDVTNHVVLFENITMHDVDDADIYLNNTNVSSSIPLAVFYATGRGEYYNDFKIKFTKSANVDYVYVLDIYAKNIDGYYDIADSFDVTFRKDIRDYSGDSMFIEDVLDKYCDYIKCKVNPNLTFDQVYRLLTQDIVNNTGYNIVDVKGVIFDDDIIENPSTGDKYFVAESALGEFYDFIGKVIKYDDLTGDFVEDTSVTVGYGDLIQTEDGKLYYHMGAGFVGDFDPYATYFIIPVDVNDDPSFRQFGGGSSGSLFNADGTINPTVANECLIKAYSGIYDSQVIDVENIYFSIVYDGGYPKAVKDAIVQLAYALRKDCVAILDNGRNRNLEQELRARRMEQSYNTYHCAIYSQYRKVTDPFSGMKLWVSPVYHMAQIIPYNDTVGELWFAPAGFNRAAIQDIDELEYNPLQGDRDQMYLNQINPTVLFNAGYVVWGQLTSQRKPSKMQSLNVVRMVLYIDRALKQFSKYFIFEQNDEITWTQVKGEVIRFLEDIKNRRGLYDYNVEVGATEYEKKRKTFHINIELDPIEPVEKILLNFYIK
jgi:hypothetical protein